MHFFTDPNNLAFEEHMNALTKLGVRKAEVAKRLGLSIGHLSRVLGGERHATEENVKALKVLLTEKRSEIIQDHCSDQPHEFKLKSTYSNEMMSDENKQAIFEEALKKMTAESHQVELPNGLKGAVVENGRGCYIPLVDSRLSPAEYNRVLKHELDSIYQSQAIPDVQSPDPQIEDISLLIIDDEQYESENE